MVMVIAIRQRNAALGGSMTAARDRGAPGAARRRRARKTV